jgi:hypothetical protein
VLVVCSGCLPDHHDQVTLQTLAGALARHSPTIFTVDSDPPAPTDTTWLWLRTLEAQTPLAFSHTYLHDLPGLLRRFAPNITGYVTYDAGSTNAALIRVAASLGVVVTAGSAATASLLEHLGVPLAADMSGTTPHAAFEAAKGNLSMRVAVFQPDDGGKAQCLSDYSTFARAATVEAPASGASAGFSAVLDHLDATRLNAAFGWGGDEHEWVAHTTRAGAVAHASDFAQNLAFLSQVRTPPSPPPPPPPPPPAPAPGRGVHTVAFITSDGDNIQLLEHADFVDAAHYGSPDRGAIPVGWSYSPAMAALMPPLLSAVRANRTANDSLQAGPSGAGYAYPQLFSAAHGAAFARATAELMRRSGQRLALVIGVAPSAESVAPLLAQEQVDGIVYMTFGAARMGYAGLHGNVAYVGGKPVVGTRLSLWGDATAGDKVGVDGLVAQLKTLPKDPSDPNSYSVVVSELGNGYAPLLRAATLLRQAGGFDVVLPETLMARLVERSSRRQQCPMPTGAWATQGGDLPKCWIAGNGSCVFACENLKLGALPVPRTARCDLNACSNLTLEMAGGRPRFLCAGDAARPCPDRSAAA